MRDEGFSSAVRPTGRMECGVFRTVFPMERRLNRLHDTIKAIK